MKVRITAYKGILCIEAQEPFVKDEGFLPNNDGRVGCLVMGTKEHLGVSQEALDLLKTIPRSLDDIGDVMWWGDKGKFYFGWLGSPRTLVDPKRCEGDRRYAVPNGEYILIPNEVPEGAMEALYVPDAIDD